MTGDDSVTEVRTYFVRGRNALVARGEMSRLYVDFYLHLADWGIAIDEAGAEMAKRALAAVTLHSAARPRNEIVAWTVNFQSPLMNVFAAADNPQGAVVASVFTEHVREGSQNLFYSDLVKDGAQPRRSVVDFAGGDFFRAVEQYYERSEQRPARFFAHGEEDFVFVVAQPDCDLEWLAGLTDESIRTLDRGETLALLEQRGYRFECGCNQERMMRILLPPFQRDPEGLFGGEEVVRIQCPRCGARHAITRESLEALDRAGEAVDGAA